MGPGGNKNWHSKTLITNNFFQAVSSNGEVGVVMDDEAGGFDGEAFPSGSVTENWSDQLTMKVKVIIISIKILIG